jgi:hypothetical protein
MFINISRKIAFLNPNIITTLLIKDLSNQTEASYNQKPKNITFKIK